jgi:hypothetical protein
MAPSPTTVAVFPASSPIARKCSHRRSCWRRHPSSSRLATVSIHPMTCSGMFGTRTPLAFVTATPRASRAPIGRWPTPADPHRSTPVHRPARPVPRLHRGRRRPARRSPVALPQRGRCRPDVVLREPFLYGSAHREVGSPWVLSRNTAMSGVSVTMVTADRRQDRRSAFSRPVHNYPPSEGSAVRIGPSRSFPGCGLRVHE